jgi:hypothetical protein
MAYVKKVRVVMFISMALLMNIVLTVQPLYAQAPNCEQCDDLIDDPIEYAECVEENCNDSIPVDTDAWILIIMGIGMAGYTFYKSSYSVKHRTIA